MKKPIATKKKHETNVHQEVLLDDYYWLREKENPEVIQYLEEENAYTEAMTASYKELEETLYTEMVGRIQETDLSVPVKRGDYFYYSRTEEGKNYSIYCRKFNSLEAEEEIILDGNALAEGKKFFSLGAFSVSENQQLLAYSVDFDGSEVYDIYIKDLATGNLLEDQIKACGRSLVWANDNQTIFYSTLDETHRPYRLYRHQLSTLQAKDELVFEEPDAAYFLYAYKSKSKDYIFIQLGSKVTSEVHFLDANQPNAPFRVLNKKVQNEEYSVSHHGDSFYILTNENAENFKIMQVPCDAPQRENRKTFLAHDPKVLISDIEAFEDYLVIYCRKEGNQAIQVYSFKTQEAYYINFPEPVYTFWGGSNPNFYSKKIRFTYSSLITPRTVFDFHLDSQEFEKKKEYEVLGGYEKENYTSERLWATAEDGTQIPISLVYKKGIKKDGNNPLQLYAYGSYGSSTDPYFSTLRLSLLDRGFIFAIAHIRGGSEMGRRWYLDGKFLKKKNTFTDFINCAEHLIKAQYTQASKLAIYGGSAGGLLMGAVINMRPDLFGAVVAAVPFVDVINTMLDETIPLTIVEFEEWGNPKDEVYYKYMKSYSPYDNVEAKDYPPILVTAGLNDPRVQYWEPAKWVAKLRDLKTDQNLLLLKTNMGAGHGGASGRYEAIKEIAFNYSFVIKTVGTLAK